MSPELQSSLDYESKLDRSAAQMHRLMEDGARQAAAFLKARVPAPAAEDAVYDREVIPDV
jgi:hypothetical protein